MKEERRSMTRRKALQTMAIGGSATLAGCWAGSPTSIATPGESNEEGAVILSVSMQDFDFWDHLTFSCLQGLANRSGPRLYLNVATLLPDRSLRWKSWYRNEYGWSFQRIRNPRRVFEVEWPFDGYVLVDSETRQSANIAANYAATNDLLPVTKSFLETTAGLPELPVQFDLRGQFRDMNRAEIYEWAYEHQWPDSNQGTVANIYLDGFRTQGIRDYVVANRGFFFELSSDPTMNDQYEVRDRFLRELADPGYVFGWSTHGTLDTEPQYVAHASRHAAPVVMSQRMHNLTIHQQVPVGSRISLPSPPNETDLEVEDAVYVTFVISDGDALGSLHDHYFFNWHDTDHDAQPLGWEIQPLLIDLAPGIFEYYVKNAGENEAFVAASGSIGYTHPRHVPSDDLPTLLEETKSYLERTNLRTLTAIDGGPKTMAETYDRVLGDHLYGVISGYVDRGYANYILDSIAWAATELPDEKGQSLVDSIRRIADGTNSRPQFVPVHVPITSLSAKDAERASRTLGEADDIRVVEPDGFFLRLQQHLDSLSKVTFDFNRTVSPTASDNRQLAFAIDTLEFLAGSGDRIAIYDIGSGIDVPMDGHYIAEDAADRTFRWFGTESAEAVFLLPPNVVSESEVMTVVGRPVVETISAEVSLESDVLDRLAFTPGWSEYQIQLR